MKILTYIYVVLAIGMIVACTSAEANVDAVQASVKGAKVMVKKDTTPTAVTRKIAERPNRNGYITSKSRPKAEIKQTFPFDLALTDGVGKKTSTEKIFKKGKPTVVLFWLTTCYPCRVEMAAIKKKYEQWQDETDFNLVAVSTDFDKNYDNYLKYVEKADWPWEAYHDSNREFRNVLPGGLNGLPQTFVFDANGEIAYHKRKFRSGDEDKLYEEIKKLAAR
jgi:cytochrome oxidase Cu insertion factor (SCO1/SenC/PrrC family)